MSTVFSPAASESGIYIIEGNSLINLSCLLVRLAPKIDVEFLKHLEALSTKRSIRPSTAKRGCVLSRLSISYSVFTEQFLGYKTLGICSPVISLPSKLISLLFSLTGIINLFLKRVPLIRVSSTYLQPAFIAVDTLMPLL